MSKLVKPSECTDDQLLQAISDHLIKNMVDGELAMEICKELRRRITHEDFPLSPHIILYDEPIINFIRNTLDMKQVNGENYYLIGLTWNRIAKNQP